MSTQFTSDFRRDGSNPSGFPRGFPQMFSALRLLRTKWSARYAPLIFSFFFKEEISARSAGLGRFVSLFPSFFLSRASTQRTTSRALNVLDRFPGPAQSARVAFLFCFVLFLLLTAFRRAPKGLLPSFVFFPGFIKVILPLFLNIDCGLSGLH